MTKSIAISIPQRAEYGSLELIAYMRQATAKGFFSTLALIGILLAAYLLTPKLEIPHQRPLTHPPIVTEIGRFTVEPTITFPTAMGSPICTYSPFISGATYIPIPDALVDDSKSEIATVATQGSSTSRGGDNPGGTGDGVLEGSPGTQSISAAQNIVVAQDIEPKIEDLQIVEKEPEFDLSALSAQVQYPEVARKIGLEGKVIIGVLVSKSGLVKKTKILSSDSPLFDKAAVNAVEKTVFTPAINDGRPVDCWVNIPISFKLK